MWRLWLLGGIIVVVTGLALDYRATKAEKARLEKELTKANATVQVQDEVMQSRDAINNRERALTDEIESAPDSDDGPIAPVLRRAIDSLHGAGSH